MRLIVHEREISEESLRYTPPHPGRQPVTPSSSVLLKSGCVGWVRKNGGSVVFPKYNFFILYYVEFPMFSGL